MQAGGMPPPDRSAQTNAAGTPSPFSFVSSNDPTIDSAQHIQENSLGRLEQSIKADKPDLKEHNWSILSALSSVGGSIKSAASTIATAVANVWNKIFNKESMVIDDSGHEDLYSRIESSDSNKSSEAEAESALNSLEDIANEAEQIQQTAVETPVPQTDPAIVKGEALRFASFLDKQNKDYQPKLNVIKEDASPSDLKKLASAEENLSNAFAELTKNPTTENRNHLEKAWDGLRSTANSINKNILADKQAKVDKFKAEIETIRNDLKGDPLAGKKYHPMHDYFRHADSNTTQLIADHLRKAENSLKYPDIKFDPEAALKEIREAVVNRNAQLEKAKDF